MREVFGAFEHERVEVTYTAGDINGVRAGELIVSQVRRRRQAMLPL
jgi:hypothetical protein